MSGRDWQNSLTIMMPNNSMLYRLIRYAQGVSPMDKSICAHNKQYPDGWHVRYANGHAAVYLGVNKVREFYRRECADPAKSADDYIAMRQHLKRMSDRFLYGKIM
jgi:hypothetical protein